MDRTIITTAVGGAGALAVAASAYFSWISDRAATDLPIAALAQTDTSDTPTSYWTSLAAPLAIVGAIGVLAALLRSRVGLAVAWFAGAMSALLWFVMRMIDSSNAEGSGVGVTIALVGLVILFGAIVAMGPRRDVVVDRSLSVFDGDPPQ